MSLARSSDRLPSPAETIVAIATPPGRGGVGIVRVSGPDAIRIAEKLGRRAFQPRLATLTRFRSESGELLDEGLTITFEAGASFTGEPVAELQGHGGPIVLERLVRAVIREGARFARPGEFSERAFLNGRMDLVQAEAVADLIASGTEAAARGALRSLSGEFSQAVDSIAAELRSIRVQLEALIDFPDEEIDQALIDLSQARLLELNTQLDALINKARQGVRLTQGAVIAIVGQPNVGKSSLLNALAKEDAAIVTDIPGTTRDLVRVDLELEGLPIRLLDTAGLRLTTDTVEQEGIRRALAVLPSADLVLVVRDARNSGEDGLPSHWLSDVKQVLTVGNKADLGASSSHNCDVLVSARTGEGLNALTRAITAALGFQSEGSTFTARQRHVDLLERAVGHTAAASALLTTNLGIELMAEELRLAHERLGEIVGRVSADQLLGDIFSTFCIGK